MSCTLSLVVLQNSSTAECLPLISISILRATLLSFVYLCIYLTVFYLVHSYVEHQSNSPSLRQITILPTPDTLARCILRSGTRKGNMGYNGYRCTHLERSQCKQRSNYSALLSMMEIEPLVWWYTETAAMQSRSNCTRIGTSYLLHDVHGYYNARAVHTAWTQIWKTGLHTYCEIKR